MTRVKKRVYVANYNYKMLLFEMRGKDGLSDPNGPLLHVYSRMKALVGQLRGIRGLVEYLSAELAASDGKKKCGLR